MRPFSQYESFRQHDWGSQFWANFVAAAKNVNRLAELIAKTIPSAADREREDLRRARRPTETLHGANAPAPCPGLILRMIHGHMSGKTLVRGGAATLGVASPASRRRPRARSRRGTVRSFRFASRLGRSDQGLERWFGSRPPHALHSTSGSTLKLERDSRLRARAQCHVLDGLESPEQIRVIIAHVMGGFAGAVSWVSLEKRNLQPG